MQFGCFTQARLFQPSGTKNGRPNLKQAMRATSAVHRRCGPHRLLQVRAAVFCAGRLKQARLSKTAELHDTGGLIASVYAAGKAAALE
jgi:hypothetical protein